MNNKVSRNHLRAIPRQWPHLGSQWPEGRSSSWASQCRPSVSDIFFLTAAGRKTNTRQSLFMMAVAMPPWMERGVASQPVGKVLGLLASPDELHDSGEQLVAVVLLLLLQLQHEEEAEGGLQHHPVHHAQQGDVLGQENNVLPLVEWRSPAFQDLAKFGETKDVPSHISLFWWRQVKSSNKPLSGQLRRHCFVEKIKAWFSL